MFLTIAFINFYNNGNRKMKKGTLQKSVSKGTVPFALKGYI